MWFFKDKVASLGDSGVMTDLTDWHSHVLPGVDDGIKTIEESLEVLRHFDEKGSVHYGSLHISWRIFLTPPIA